MTSADGAPPKDAGKPLIGGPAPVSSESDFTRLSGGPGVSTARPLDLGGPQAPIHPQGERSLGPLPPDPASSIPPTAPQRPAAAPGDGPRPFIRQNGRLHPLKPQTPPQIAEFAILWRNPLYSVEQIAKRYKCSDRTIQKWRVQFGLGPRDQLLRLQEQGATIASAAGQVAHDMHDAAATIAEIGKAQAVLGIRLGLDGGRKNPEHARADTHGETSGWDPIKDPEIASLLDEIRAEARQITQHSDLTALQRRLAKVAILVSTKMPTYTWESLQAILDTLSRTILWARKVEADIPQGKADPVLLRQEAGRQMMRELRAVLSPEEQEALAKLVKVGADRIMARKGRIAD